MKIYANDGREFKGDNPHHLVDECNAYEADIKLKKAQEETEKKAKEVKREVLASSIKEQIVNIKNDIDSFKKHGGCAIRLNNSTVLYCNEDGSIYISNYSKDYKCKISRDLDDVLKNLGNKYL